LLFQENEGQQSDTFFPKSPVVFCSWIDQNWACFAGLSDCLCNTSSLKCYFRQTLGKLAIWYLLYNVHSILRCKKFFGT